MNFQAEDKNALNKYSKFTKNLNIAESNSFSTIWKYTKSNWSQVEAISGQPLILWNVELNIISLNTTRFFFIIFKQEQSEP